MRRVLLALPLVLVGCIVDPTPDREPIPAPGVEEAHIPGARFEVVNFLPSEPRSDQEVMVRARVSAPGFARGPYCLATRGGDGWSGGGWQSSLQMREVDHYSFECIALPLAGSDFLTVILVAHDGRDWVRSELFTLRMPDGSGANMPSSHIAAVGFENESNGDLRVRLDMQVPPAVGPHGFTTGILELHRLARDHDGLMAASFRMQPDGIGRLSATYPQILSSRGPPTEAEQDPDFVLLGFGYTYNQLNGFDITGLIELGHGACATERCIRI